MEPGEKFAIVIFVNTPDAVHPLAIEYTADASTAKVDLKRRRGLCQRRMVLSMGKCRGCGVIVISVSRHMQEGRPLAGGNTWKRSALLLCGRDSGSWHDASCVCYLPKLPAIRTRGSGACGMERIAEAELALNRRVTMQ